MLTYVKESGCSPFAIKDVQRSEFPYMTLIDSGKCDIRLQTLNAQKAGAELAIIVKKREEDYQEMKDHADAQTGMIVNIPTLIVEPSIGNRLKGVINTTGQVALRFQMPVPQSNTIEVEFRIKDSDLNFYGFLGDFKKKYLQFEQRVEGTFSFYSEDNDKEDKAKMEAMVNCIDYDVVFDVLELYGTNCAKVKMCNSACLIDQIKSISSNLFVSYKRCYNTFNINKLNKLKDDLRDGKKIKKSTIVINGYTYLGSIKPENVFEAMCGSFLESPDNCLFLQNKYSHSIRYDDFRSENRFKRSMLILVNVVVLLCLLIIAGAVMVLIFGKIYQKILNEKVAMMVKDSIDNYQTLKENV